jgi:hypothetical protein
VKAKPKLHLVLPKKPMARALRVTLFEREVRVRLSSPAVDLLLDRAQLLVEGKRAASATGGGAFFGSCMLTIDLARLAPDVRDPCDDATARRVAELLAGDTRVTRRVQKLAERETARLAGGPVTARAPDVRVRSDGNIVYIDVDVEGPPRT